MYEPHTALDSINGDFLAVKRIPKPWVLAAFFWYFLPLLAKSTPPEAAQGENGLPAMHKESVSSFAATASLTPGCALLAMANGIKYDVISIFRQSLPCARGGGSAQPNRRGCPCLPLRFIKSPASPRPSPASAAASAPARPPGPRRPAPRWPGSPPPRPGPAAAPPPHRRSSPLP